MAYITSDGQIQQSRPWGLSRIFEIIMGTVSFVNFFFRGLFHLDDPSTRGRYGQAPRGNMRMPRRGMGGVGRVGGVAPPPPACFSGG